MKSIFYRVSRPSAANSEAGFTIVEIMIATLVFATVLVLITTGVITFTRNYYAGVTQSQTQDKTKQIIENISQAIQFSGEKISDMRSGAGGWRGICIGNDAYEYRLGKQLADNATRPDQVTKALILKTGLGGCSSATAGTTSSLRDGTELLSPNMRLSNLVVDNVSGRLWQITVEIAYGDSDLLHSMTGSGGAQATDVACNDNAGSQFCAVSKLVTTVGQRINPQRVNP